MTKKMIVLYPILHYPPVIGGLEQWEKNIAERQPKDIKVIIVTGKVKGEPIFEKDKNISVFRTSLFELEDLSHSSWIYIVGAIPFILFRSYMISRRAGVDLFHCHGFLSALMGYILSSATKKPFMGTEQSLGWSGWPNGFLRGIVYRKSSLCIASSRAVAEEFKKIGVEKIKVIPNGVDLSRFKNLRSAGRRNTTSSRELTILSVGRLEEVKGHKYLIEAFWEIKKDVPSARLVLVGDGSKRKSLEQQTLLLGLTAAVEFVGEVSHDKLSKYYREADIFAMPSLSEGFGITAIEAMATGVPTIASDVGGLVDIIEDGKSGILVTPKNSQELARAILRLSNPKTAKLFSTEGMKRAKRFSWDKISASVSLLYKELQNKKRLNVMFACSILPPNIGGPAYYAKNLAYALEGCGNNVSIIGEGDARSFIKLLGHVSRADICYVLTSSPGILLPAIFAARLRGKKLAIRIGGDFLWERAVEAGRTRIPLRLFYINYKKTLKEKLTLIILRYLLIHADLLVFTTEFQRDLYKKHYSLSGKNFAVVENPYPEDANKKLRRFPESQPFVLYAGRLLKLKNLETLLAAFKEFTGRTDRKVFLKIFGEGPEEESLKNLVNKLGLTDRVIFSSPIDQYKLSEEFVNCWLAILPSYSEVSPNFVLEACAYAAPVITTQETYFAKDYVNRLVSFDPNDPHILAEKFVEFLVPEVWENYQKKIIGMDTSRNFQKVAAEHDVLFKNIKRI